MTREEYAKLTYEERQIKIAELCGWNCNRRFCYLDSNGTSRAKSQLPCYLYDLNAMHEAWLNLTYLQQVAVVEVLGAIVCETKNRNDWVWMDIANATAAQRAEAFVMTLSDKVTP